MKASAACTLICLSCVLQGTVFGAPILDGRFVAWSPDAERIACADGDAISVRWVTDPQKAQEFPGLSAKACNLCWSADGRSIFYVSDKAGSWDLWQLRVGTGEHFPISVAPGKDRCPVVLPGGSALAFISDRNLTEDVWIFDFATGKCFPLSSDEAGVDCLRAAHDGDAFAYVRRDGYERAEIVLVRWPGGESYRFPLDRSDILDLAISPRGDKLAWSSFGEVCEADIRGRQPPELVVQRRLRDPFVSVAYMPGGEMVRFPALAVPAADKDTEAYRVPMLYLHAVPCPTGDRIATVAGGLKDGATAGVYLTGLEDQKGLLKRLQEDEQMPEPSFSVPLRTRALRSRPDEVLLYTTQVGFAFPQPDDLARVFEAPDERSTVNEALREELAAQKAPTPEGLIELLERGIGGLPEAERGEWRIGHFSPLFEERVRMIADYAGAREGAKWQAARLLAEACLAWHEEDLEESLAALCALEKRCGPDDDEARECVAAVRAAVRFFTANAYQTNRKLGPALRHWDRFLAERGGDYALEYRTIIAELERMHRRYPYVVERWLDAERALRLGPWRRPEEARSVPVGEESTTDICIAAHSAIESFAAYRLMSERYEGLAPCAWADYRLAMLAPSWQKTRAYGRYLMKHSGDRFFEQALLDLVAVADIQENADTVLMMLENVTPSSGEERAMLELTRLRLRRMTTRWITREGT